MNTLSEMCIWLTLLCESGINWDKMNFVRAPIPKESSLLESGSRASEISVQKKVEDLLGDGKMMANFFPP